MMQASTPGGKSFVIKLRGLPWSSSLHNVQSFLSGCAIHNGITGIHFVYNRVGKQSGEVFVEMESQKDVKLALKKDRERMGHRYIEVFKSHQIEMDWMLKHSGPIKSGSTNDNLVQLLGLPSGCSREQIVQFLTGLDIVSKGITLSVDSEGKMTEEAFLQIDSKELAEKAQEKIGQTYVEALKSNPEEITSSSELPLNLSSVYRPGPYDRPGTEQRYRKILKHPGQQRMRSSAYNAACWGYEEHCGYGAGYAGYEGFHGYSAGCGSYDRYNGCGAVFGGYDGYNGLSATYWGYHGYSGYEGYTGYCVTYGGYPWCNGFCASYGGYEVCSSFSDCRFASSELGSDLNYCSLGMYDHKYKKGEFKVQSTNGHCVRMRGLPFRATQNDIYNFFNPFSPLEVHIEIGPEGSVTGQANIVFATHEEAVAAMSKDKTNMEHRYIELFLDSKISTDTESTKSQVLTKTGLSFGEATSSGLESCSVND
ncbi:heterogeneous nuclear ribonucleoprotein F-like [Thomomys bottae]